MTLQGLSPYSEQHRGWNEWERQKSTQRSRKKKKKNKGRVGPIHLSVHVCFGDFWSVTQAIPCQPSLLADTEEVALNAACCACVALESREGCLEGEHSHSFKGYLKNAALCPVTCCSALNPMETWNNVSVKNAWCQCASPVLPIKLALMKDCSVDTEIKIIIVAQIFFFSVRKPPNNSFS